MMNDTVYDGGPAFPVTTATQVGNIQRTDVAQPGMSLRDWFAGQALVGLVQKQPLLDHEGVHGPKFTDADILVFRRDMATAAYEYADFLLANRRRAMKLNTGSDGGIPSNGHTKMSELALKSAPVGAGSESPMISRAGTERNAGGNLPGSDPASIPEWVPNASELFKARANVKPYEDFEGGWGAVRQLIASRAPAALRWKPITTIPERGVPIVMRGPSGYGPPKDVNYVSGYYDAEYRPHSPWQTVGNDAVTDYFPMPVEWCYRSELENCCAQAAPVVDVLALMRAYHGEGPEVAVASDLIEAMTHTLAAQGVRTKGGA